VFIAEGRRTVETLLDKGWPVDSVLLSETRARSDASLVSRAAAAGAVIYTAPQAVLDGLSGFHVHRGVLAVARRPAPRPVAEVEAEAGPLLLGVEGVNDLENLGALFRNAAALGAGAVLLDPTAADPLYRRAVRVSLGQVLAVPFARSRDWPADLQRLRQAGRKVAALTPAGAVPLRRLDPSGRWAVLVGAEGDGLSPAALAAADVTVRIPLAPGVDSLNVATAAAIALYHLAGVAPPLAAPGPARLPASPPA
jgi:tRNA G18 (ribose-2'-O)-methylase SpoU